MKWMIPAWHPLNPTDHAVEVEDFSSIPIRMYEAIVGTENTAIGYHNPEKRYIEPFWLRFLRWIARHL